MVNWVDFLDSLMKIFMNFMKLKWDAMELLKLSWMIDNSLDQELHESTWRYQESKGRKKPIFSMMNEKWEISLATIYTPNRSFKYFNDLSHVAHRFLYVVKSTIFIASVLVSRRKKNKLLLVFVENKKKINLEGKFID